MKYAFIFACDFRLEDAWNDTSRWYKADDACSTNFFPGVSNCPYALCRTGDTDGSDEYQAYELGGIAYDGEGIVYYEHLR